MIRIDDIKKHGPEEWYLEHAPARPLMISGIVRGFADGLKPKEYSFVLNYYRKGELDWCTLIEDQNRIAELIFREHEKDGSCWKKEFEKYLKTKKRLEQNFDKERKKDIGKISGKELVKNIRAYTELQWETRKTDCIVDPFILASERELTGLLDGFVKSNKDIDPKKAYEILTRPEEPSFVNIAELEITEIAKGISKNNAIKKMFLSGSVKEEDVAETEIGKKINEHIKRFPWLKVESFYGGRDYRFEDVASRIRDILGKEPRKEGKKDDVWRNNKKIREEYIAKHKFSRRILTIAELSPLFARWQDLRKENSLMTTYLHSKYLKELSKRTGIKEDCLAYLDYTEIENVLNKKIGESELKKRENSCMFVFTKGEFRLFHDDEIKEFIDKIIHPEKTDVKEFSGIGASPGRARGIARIVIRQEDISKVKEGDILVSTMTRPEHVPAIKRAAAIVTNEGGVTCHAAILSREFGRPCVIGTKIATKVLKDGDLIEVDADNGMVRKLK